MNSVPPCELAFRNRAGVRRLPGHPLHSLTLPAMLFQRSLPRSVLLPAALCLGLCTMAQDKPKKPQAKVILYKDRIAAQFDTVDCVKNVVKVNPLLFFRGEVPLYFERALTTDLSVEVGLGVTLRDYLNFSVQGDQPDDFGAGTELVPQLSYHFGARWYFTPDLEPQGWYAQIGFSHLNYTKDIRLKDDSTGTFIDSYLTDERIYNDLRLYGGYQLLSGTNNWLFDLYFGLGMRDRSLTKVDENIEFVQVNGEMTEVRTYELVEVSDVVPTLFLGVKVGVGF